MIDGVAILGMALVSLGMVLTPGPNMIYLVSRTISQGRRAGLISLVGVATGLLVYLVATAAGLTAVFAAVPMAYTVLKVAGAAYLLYLAWQAFRPGGRSPFSPEPVAAADPLRLYGMGLLTALLNPKIAILYVSLLPQFIDPSGNVVVQSLALGGVQIVVAMVGNAAIAMSAGGLAGFLRQHPVWMRVQRWFMGTVLAGFAVRMAVDPTRV